MNEFMDKVETAIQAIQHIYHTRNNLVVGYSCGKDSTATLGLTRMALSQLSPEERTKPRSVISTDTLVEQPIVAAWVTRSLNKMNESARQQSIPITAHRLVPELKDRYWVNLLGRRYGAPRNGFRWLFLKWGRLC